MATAKYSNLNREKIIDFFHGGECGAGNTRLLGVEVEHFVLGDDGSQISYEPRDGRIGIRDVLNQLIDDYPNGSYNAHRDLLGLVGDEGSVSLEPAAQLEISIAPYERISDVELAYQHFRSRVDAILDARNAHIEAHGYHPTRRAQELTLIPKQRYDFMNDYFEHIGSDGDHMMRASASTQVSVDYADESDAVRKMRVASALAPILTAITDNTTIFEAEPNHIPLRRLQLWREVDNRRCGTVPSVFDDNFGFAVYTDWLLRTSPIFVTRPAADDLGGKRLRAAYETSSAEIYSDAPMSNSDIEHLISMFWPDVRLKHFVEIRPADCLPKAELLGYAALIKGLFYSEASLAAIESELGVDPQAAATRGAWPIDANDVTRAITAIQKQGFDAEMYGKTLRDWEALLFDLARAVLDEGERPYLEPLVRFAANKDWWNVGV